MKYVQKGNLGENANARAFKRLINEHILPIESKCLFPAWQSFREEHIWTFEVNKLLENNLQAIKEIFKSMVGVRNLKLVHCHEAVTS